jgi:hypothetical protein
MYLPVSCALLMWFPILRTHGRTVPGNEKGAGFAPTFSSPIDVMAPMVRHLLETEACKRLLL